MTLAYVDLVLETGEIVRVECPSKHEDEMHVTLENAMKRGDWWSPQQFDGCSATFLGLIITRVAMRRVVAIL